MTVGLDDDEDDDGPDGFDVYRPWFERVLGIAKAQVPVYSRHMYVQECPYCHAIHEKAAQFDEWCDEHLAKKEIWQRRKRPAKGDGAWECQGCEACA